MTLFHDHISIVDVNSSSMDITIVIVNWYSSEHLTRLMVNLCEKAVNLGHLSFLIMDNTRGKDADLIPGIESVKKMLDGAIANRVQVYQTEGPELRGSYAHANALDQALQKLETPYVLIMDPDVYIFAEEWDKLLLNELCPRLSAVDNSSRLSDNADSIHAAQAIGAPYPFWKLGKYHDFPSPVFLFANTTDLRNLDQTWAPFATNTLLRFYHLLCRQVVRMGFLANRRRIVSNSFFSRIGSFLETFFGVCGPDTGWLVARAAAETSMRVRLFAELAPRGKVAYSANCRKSINDAASFQDPLQELINQFECYGFHGRLFMTHKYGTGSRIWRTSRGHDTAYWLDLIQQIEDGI